MNTTQTTLQKNIGDTIKRLREQHGYSRTQLAIDITNPKGNIDETKRELARIEAGHEDALNIASIINIAHALNVPPLNIIAPLWQDRHIATNLGDITFNQLNLWLTGHQHPTGNLGIMNRYSTQRKLFHKHHETLKNINYTLGRIPNVEEALTTSYVTELTTLIATLTTHLTQSLIKNHLDATHEDVNKTFAQLTRHTKERNHITDAVKHLKALRGIRATITKTIATTEHLPTLPPLVDSLINTVDIDTLHKTLTRETITAGEETAANDH